MGHSGRPTLVCALGGPVGRPHLSSAARSSAGDYLWARTQRRRRGLVREHTGADEIESEAKVDGGERRRERRRLIACDPSHVMARRRGDVHCIGPSSFLSAEKPPKPSHPHAPHSSPCRPRHGRFLHTDLLAILLRDPHPLLPVAMTIQHTNGSSKYRTLFRNSHTMSVERALRQEGNTATLSFGKHCGLPLCHRRCTLACEWSSASAKRLSGCSSCRDDSIDRPSQTPLLTHWPHRTSD